MHIFIYMTDKRLLFAYFSKLLQIITIRIDSKMSNRIRIEVPNAECSPVIPPSCPLCVSPGCSCNSINFCCRISGVTSWMDKEHPPADCWRWHRCGGFQFCKFKPFFYSLYCQMTAWLFAKCLVHFFFFMTVPHYYYFLFISYYDYYFVFMLLLRSLVLI